MAPAEGDPFVIGWDLGSQRNGWAAWGGVGVPIAGAFRLDRVTPEQLGDMGVQFKTRVLEVHRRFPQATHWVSERPITKPTDVLFTQERLMGLSCLLQTIGRSLGKVCRMVDNGAAKREWAGRGPDGSPATKDMMIAIAERVGIELPLTDADGREDAADACGVLKVGVRLFARPYLERLDRAVYGSRGALI